MLPTLQPGLIDDLQAGVFLLNMSIVGVYKIIEWHKQCNRLKHLFLIAVRTEEHFLSKINRREEDVGVQG